MKKNVMDFLSNIEKRTDISVDYSTVANIGNIEADNMDDIDTFKSLVIAFYTSEISLKGQSLSLVTEHYSTDTCGKTASVQIPTPNGAVDYFCGAQVLGRIRTVYPDLPVHIEPI